jgi:hypothetical protein|eukprot:COSAG02_NODE_5291_length_4468_cov_358.403525_7_plen_192_part_00
MDFLSSVRKQAEVAAATVAEAAAQAMDTPTPRSAASSVGSGTLLTPTNSNTSSTLETLRSDEPCQTRMATIEMMTPRSPPNLGVPAPVAAGDAGRGFIAARREALGDRWLLGLGPALASAASQRGDATAPMVSPSASSIEPFADDGADLDETERDSMKWLLDELVVRMLGQLVPLACRSRAGWSKTSCLPV